MNAEPTRLALEWLAFAFGDLEPDTWRVKRHPKDLSRLTDYGVDVKYPDSAIQVTPLQAAVAVRQAIAVIRAVRHDFERLGVRVDGLRPE